jgi:outer membrane protein assembly factor BamB
MTCCRIAAWAACLFTISFCSARGENWPGWRGPRGDGTSAESNVPVRWNVAAGENVLWKTPLAAGGHSSPIVWQERVFVTGCVADTQERMLICLERDSGKVSWQKTVLNAPLETKHALNSFASSTPATDGKLVFVSFLEVDGHTIPAPNVSNVRPVTPGKMAVAAYDFAGNRKWLARAGDFISAHGYCASPVLFENLVIVNGDHDGESYVVALDKTTGQEAWRAPRANKIRSYVTPLIRETAGRTQMVFSGSLHVASLDPRTGKTHWTVDGPAEQFVASPVFDGEKFFIAGGFPTHHVLGIRPGGNGNVTDTHVAWHATNAKCYVPSPVLAGGYLIVADDRGTANCFVAATGERLWQERLGSHFSGSLVAAGGLVYLTADDGTTKVIRPGPQLEVVAENSLGEHIYSSPAIADGRVFFRGEKHLICVGNEEAAGK